MPKKKTPPNNEPSSAPEPHSLSKKIYDILHRDAPATLRVIDIAKQLNIRSDTPEYEILRTEINTLVQNKTIHRSARRRLGLKPVSQNTTLFEGVLKYEHNRGMISTDSTDFPVIFIRQQYLATALDGDKVQVKLLALKKDKKPYGTVLNVTERANILIAGTLDYDGDFYFLVPDEDKHYLDFLIPPKKLKGATKGDKVVGRFLRWEDAHKSPEAEIVEVLGRSGNPSVEFSGVLKEFGLSAKFDDLLEEQARKVAIQPTPKSITNGRIDLRKEEIITIDPDDARDFDDALSLTILENKNYRLGVHIADVTHYLEADTPLDHEAYNRANSTYLVDRVVPMLPESLSNDICSLVPDKIRFAYSVFMEFTPKGLLKNYEIAETAIKSKKRFTYNEVQEIIISGKGKHLELINNLFTLSKLLRAKRFEKGGLDFETTETKFQLDENGSPVKAVIKSGNDATKLVEECMLAANQTVALHIKNISKKMKLRHPLPFFYRIHDSPDAAKLKDVLNFVRSLGIKTKLENLTSKEINHLLLQVEELPEKKVIHQFVLRAMAKAVYSENNIGHYGLGFSDYAHFTSPIRRYPDVIIHRLLKEYAHGLPSPQKIVVHNSELSAASAHCSLRERQSVEAERASTKLAQTILAQKNLGSEFNATVSGVTSFGVFVLLDEVGIEGLLHIRDLTDDYYIFDEKNFQLVGRRRKQSYRIGTRLRVQIAHVNLDKREIDLKLVGNAEE
ncbi:MAG: ribonuclease R [Bacteroidetes bacterium]|nr:ribonuclease R [Bacteroidota bacterium]